MPNREEYRDSEGRTYQERVADKVFGVIAAQGKYVRGVARESGMNRQNLQDSINNKRPFKTTELSLMAATLGVHLAEFVNIPIENE